MTRSSSRFWVRMFGIAAPLDYRAWALPSDFDTRFRSSRGDRRSQGFKPSDYPAASVAACVCIGRNGAITATRRAVAPLHCCMVIYKSLYKSLRLARRADRPAVRDLVGAVACARRRRRALFFAPRQRKGGEGVRPAHGYRAPPRLRWGQPGLRLSHVRGGLGAPLRHLLRDSAQPRSRSKRDSKEARLRLSHRH